MICVLSKFVLKMVNWLAGILVFSHSCGLVGSARTRPCCYCCPLPEGLLLFVQSQRLVTTSGLLNAFFRVRFKGICNIFPNSRPFYTKSSACYVMVLSCDGTWNEATLLVELTPLCNCLKVRRAWQRERATERAQHVMQVSLLQPKIFRIFYLSGQQYLSQRTFPNEKLIT